MLFAAFVVLVLVLVLSSHLYAFVSAGFTFVSTTCSSHNPTCKRAMERFSQIFVQTLKRPNIYSSTRRCFAEGISSSSPKSVTPTKNLGDVPGLSSAVLQTPSEAVGPGASKSSDYKNPEYFSYHSTSYYEAEIEMSKYRCQQPSNKVPFKPTGTLT